MQPRSRVSPEPSNAFARLRQTCRVRVLDPFNLAGARGGETPAALHSEFRRRRSTLAEALIPDERPARKSRANGAASLAHVPTAGAMQLLKTAVTHSPVRFTWSRLAALNGRKARGGHFNTRRRLLIDGGFVTETARLSLPGVSAR